MQHKSLAEVTRHGARMMFKVGSKPLLWGRDFNVAPEPIDVYDSKKLHDHGGFHPDEHAVLERFRRWGLTDIFRLYKSEPEQCTF